MDLQLAKLEVIEMLLQIDEESVLMKVKALLTGQVQPSLTEEEYKIIDRRRENFLNGKTKSLTWEQVKENALKQTS